MPHQMACINCGIVIRWQPTLVEGRTYCCLGCAQGGPCECDYDNLPQPGKVHAMTSGVPVNRPPQAHGSD
jgi:hypothetical protein